MKQTQTNITELSVSDLSLMVKQQIEGNFDHVRVRGELGRVVQPASGHLYFDLKDDKSVLAAVMWKGTTGRLAMQPEQGLEVVATGKLTTFAGQSRYQLVVETMEPAGEGALMALLQARKKQFAEAGLFDAERKQALPYLPQVIGVITSPTGAVIRDILHRLADRFPRHVLLWPVRVQGESCAEEVAQAIAGFNNLSHKGGAVPRPDLLIVARGGGSLEDLWGFNEEAVVLAAAQSEIPLISAIGHETDVTLLDFVADQRAPTPTAAAEMAVPVRADLLAALSDLKTRLIRAQNNHLNRHRQNLGGLARGLPRLQDILATPAQILDNLAQRLGFGLQVNIRAHRGQFEKRVSRLSPHSLLAQHRRLSGQLGALRQRALRVRQQQSEKHHAQLAGLARNLDLLSHESVLARGFALVLAANGKAVRTPQDAPVGHVVDVRLAGDKHFNARVEKSGTPPRQANRKTKSKLKNDAQGKLL